MNKTRLCKLFLFIFKDRLFQHSPLSAGDLNPIGLVFLTILTIGFTLKYLDLPGTGRFCWGRCCCCCVVCACAAFEFPATGLALAVCGLLIAFLRQAVPKSCRSESLLHSTSVLCTTGGDCSKSASELGTC